VKPVAVGLRLTGGTARGAKLWSLPGLRVRPALARMRVSLFAVLAPRLEGAAVADLFAGTGSLGLEALSRGAARAVFLDTDPRCLEAIRLNLKKLRFEDRAEVLRADAFRAVNGLGPVDLAFVDPPYAFYEERAGEMGRLLEVLLRQVLRRPGGLAVVEHRAGRGPGPLTVGRIVDRRRYGGTEVTLYAGDRGDGN